MKKFVAWSAVAVCLWFASGAAAAESWDALNAQVIRLYQEKSYDKAVPIAQKALDAAENEHGSDSPQTVLALNNLAMLYKKTGKLTAAGPLYLRALKISEKILPAGHPDFGVPLNNLAMYYEAKKDYAKADEYSTRGIKIVEDYYGADHALVKDAKARFAQLKDARRA